MFLNDVTSQLVINKIKYCFQPKSLYLQIASDIIIILDVGRFYENKFPINSLLIINKQISIFVLIYNNSVIYINLTILILTKTT